MNHDPNISATLIGANSRNYGHIEMPDRMMPEGDDPYSIIKEKGQLCGTNAELVCELAGRVCYDSLGKGRNSEEYHKHIQEVGHGSVLEHVNFTVGGGVTEAELLWLYLWAQNRPGVWLVSDRDFATGNWLYRLSMNLRSVVEIQHWVTSGSVPFHSGVEFLASFEKGIVSCAAALAPQVVSASGLTAAAHPEVRLLAPELEEEKWVTMLLTGSRGFSHELVRHGDRTAISQRSTRYVDEDGSPWIKHPLIVAYAAQSTAHNVNMEAGLHGAMAPAQDVYRKLADELQKWLISRGVDKLTARKQARGAARGFLGNALYTEVVFSASVAQWKRILKQRACPAADAEIREVAVQALTCLQQCPYADSFTGYTIKESPDGIGEIAV